MKLENMSSASIETMAQLGFYWGGCSYDEEQPRWMAVTEVGNSAVFVLVGRSIDRCWFAEAYDLFELTATIDSCTDDDDPQKALDALFERLATLPCLKGDRCD